MNYYPKPDDNSRNKTKTEFYLCNYITKSDLKGATGIDTSE